MELTKQESVSRQSSILKPTKQRQPLQCVATNPSSSENSPTIKIKRRVSFAKNKRIREFCNEAEQGTVWDDTYEEHDLSSTKNSSSGNDQPVIITVPCDDKENFPVQLFLPNAPDQLECKEVPSNVPSEPGDNLSQCDVEMDSLINNFELSNEVQNNEIEYANATIYCDEGMEMTTYIQSEILPCPNQEVKNINNSVTVPQTCVQNNSMDFTENLPITLCRKPIQKQNSKSQFDLNSASNSTDLTQAISTLLGVGHSTKLANQKDLQNVNTDMCADRMNMSLTAPVEFSSILPSSTWIRPNSRLQNDEKTDNFTKTMDFTMAVPYNNIYNNHNMDKTSLTEKTKIFLNTSMEMTETVPIHRIAQTGAGTKKESHNATQEKTKIFSNNSMEISETIPVYKNVDQFLNHTEKIIEDLTLDNTKLFANKTMEITGTIPIYNDFEHSSVEEKKIIREMPQERTKIFSNKSMDMTDAIHNMENRCNISGERQEKMFTDVSMEMTEAISSLNKNRQAIINKKIASNILPEKTIAFVDKSMDMTEPLVSVYSENHQPVNNTQKSSHDQTQDDKTIFANKSMEITEAIPVYNSVNRVINQTKTKHHGSNYEKTKIFSNKSMDLTETVPIHYDKNKITHNTTQEKTKIFSDLSMEMTGALPMFNTDYSCKINAEAIAHNACQERTEIFVNKSMDISETIPVSGKIHDFITDNEIITSENVQEKTKLFTNKSMEMSETVPIVNKNSSSNVFSQSKISETGEKTNIINKSMEITGTVPVYRTVYESNENANKIHRRSSEKNIPFYNKSKVTNTHKQFEIGVEKISQNLFQEKIPHAINKEKTKSFCDSSIDIIEAVPIHQKISVFNELTKQDSNEEKTQYFCNRSMDMTEIIPVHQNILFNIKNQKGTNMTQEKTKLFANDSMNISETIPVHNIQKPQEVLNTEDKSEFFCNKSMDMTEGVPLNQNILFHGSDKLLRNNVQDKTKIFLNKSMDITETLPIHQQLLASNSNSQNKPGEVLEEKTKIFQDNLMDMTETVAAPNVSCKIIVETRNVPSEATQLFQNTSMDITSRLSTVPIKTQNNPESIVYKKFNYISNPGNNQCLQNNIKSKQTNTNTTNIYHDDSMEMTVGLPVLQTFGKNCQTIFGSDNKNKEVNVSSKIESGSKTANSNKKTNHQPIYESTKVFENASMEFTGIPSILSSITKDSKRCIDEYSNQSILLNKSGGIQNSINVSNYNKENNYDISDKFSTKDENFLRMTSDELNTLCASMNFPAQKYTTDETAATQNNFISSCNDINVLRDSLQKDIIFQQPESSLKSKVFSDKNISHTPAKLCKDNTKENNSPTVCNAMEQSMTGIRREENALTTTMNMSILPSSILNKSESIQNMDISMTMPVNTIEIDKTVEVNKDIEPKQLSHRSIGDIQKTSKIIAGNSKCLNQSSNENNAFKVNEAINIFEQADNRNIKNQYSSISLINKINNDRGGTIEAHESTHVSEKYINSLCTVAKSTTSLDGNKIIQVIQEEKKIPNDKLHVFHDVSMELVTVLSPPSKKRKSNETKEFVNKENVVSDIVKNMHTTTELGENSDKGGNHMILKENSLSRQPSDNTDVLIATMGFKTQLPHPLIINEETIITVSHKSIVNKTYRVGTNSVIESQTNKTYNLNENENIGNQIDSTCVIDDEVKNKDENVLKNAEIPVIRNNSAENNLEEKGDPSDKENKEPSIKVNLFPDNNLEELEEIQPPSFLCADSIQEDSIEQLKTSNNDSLNLSLNVVNEENPLISDNDVKTVPSREKPSIEEFNFFDKKSELFKAKILQLKEREKFLLEEWKKLSKEESNFLSTEKKKSKEVLSLKKDNIKQIDKLMCEKDHVSEEPLSPFLSLSDNIKKYEKRDDCIWSVRTINTKLVAIDFITKSFVVIVRLNEIEMACIKDIRKVEIISRLCVDSKNILLSIVHNLLLSKLKPSEILEKYKMYEDIIPMLEYVSTEVIFAMKFMFDLERLSAINLLNVNKERILFRVASRKSNIILKVSLKIKVFHEIRPDDIDVVCVLGDIRKSDIKQLIVNIRRDNKFLSRYINDIKNYVTLMEESTSLNKY